MVHVLDQRTARPQYFRQCSSAKSGRNRPVPQRKERQPDRRTEEDESAGTARLVAPANRDYLKSAIIRTQPKAFSRTRSAGMAIFISGLQVVGLLRKSTKACQLTVAIARSPLG